MNYQRGKTLQSADTSMSPADVLAAAKAFFGPRNSVYAAFAEKEGPNHLVMRGQGGEEVIVAAHTENGKTTVSGSSYLFDQQVARFLASLPIASGASPA
jgi:hypothetical protein